MDERSADVYMFRKLNDNKLVSVDRNQHLVDIHVEGGDSSQKAPGGQGSVQFIWDDMKVSPASKLTRLHCKLTNFGDSVSLRFSSEMVRDDFLLCRQFLKMIYSSLGSRVVRFDPRNAWFDVLHEDDLSGSKRREEMSEETVKGFLKRMLVRSEAEELKIDVELNSISKVEHQMVVAALTSTLKGYQTSLNVDRDYDHLLREQREINATIDNMAAYLQNTQPQREQPIPRDHSKDQPDPVQYDGAILHVDPYCSKKNERQEQFSLDESSHEALKELEKTASGRQKYDGDWQLYGGYQQPTVGQIPASKPCFRADGLDTVLCLDTSLSMGEDGLREVKDIALSIIDGIDLVASEYDMEENLAVVQFGGPPNIVHPLSNDYGSVRDAIESLQLCGMSPLQEAIAMCLLAMRGRSRVCRISNVHNVAPRIIIITDGKASREAVGAVDVDKASFEVRMNLFRILNDFGKKENIEMVPKPIVWIPAGRADQSFLDGLSKKGNGKLVKGSREIKRLSYYQRVQHLTASLFLAVRTMPSPMAVSQRENMKSLLCALASDLDKDDEDEILLATQAKLEGQSGSGNPPPLGNDFDNVIEDPQMTLPLGARVIRGPDWSWGEQDSQGTGTVINHGLQSTQGSVWVEWDNGSFNHYNYGNDNRYDVWEVTDHFRNISTDMPIQVGCEVTRGPNWTTEHGEQDGGTGCVGVVIRNNRNGLIKVRWKETGFIGCYHYSQTGRKEVAIRSCENLTIAIQECPDLLISLYQRPTVQC